ncbi:hypothetical protein HMPREF9565_00640 [Cutibacterium acnes HL053PA2]|nr:hypothetical protein HMPREF9565_00640 [Cutibacterium acnes HL053PA2]
MLVGYCRGLAQPSQHPRYPSITTCVKNSPTCSQTAVNPLYIAIISPLPYIKFVAR